MTRYTSAWVASDRDGWLSTFSEGATQEDPVGEGVRHGRDEIATFWDRAMASYDGIELRQRALHVIGTEAALEWTVLAKDRDEWVVFDGWMSSRSSPARSSPQCAPTGSVTRDDARENALGDRDQSTTVAMAGNPSKLGASSGSTT